MEKWMGQFRHLFTTFGGILIALGYVDSTLVEAVIGFTMAVIGMYMSWNAPEKN